MVKGVFMFKIRKVKNVDYSKFNDCVVITYEDNGIEKYAACIENLSIKSDDTVEIYTDDYVNYRGFGAIALKIV